MDILERLFDRGWDDWEGSENISMRRAAHREITFLREALAEADKDTARLDEFEKHGVHIAAGMGAYCINTDGRQTLREAIDAAIAAESGEGE